MPSDPQVVALRLTNQLLGCVFNVVAANWEQEVSEKLPYFGGFIFFYYLFFVNV